MELELKSSLNLLSEFKMHFEQKNPSLELCEKLMEQLKFVAVYFSFPEEQSFDERQKKLLLAREIIEYGSLMSVKRSDMASFERYIAQLRIFYYDYRNKLPPSKYQQIIIGLNLLRLLAKRNLDEFHTEIELLNDDELRSPYVLHPLLLEQYMMEGAYNKVLQAREDVPSEYYSFFMDILMDTIREEIAGCLEKAYQSLRVTDAQKLLGFFEERALLEYAKEHNWVINAIDGVSFVHFSSSENDKAYPKYDIRSLKVIRQTLHYARELERIV